MKLVIMTLMTIVLMSGCVEVAEEGTETENRSYYDIELFKAPPVTFDEYAENIYTRQDSDWNVAVYAPPGEGVLKIKLEKEYPNDEYGLKANAKYEDVVNIFESKYLYNNELDVCIGSEYRCEAGNYSYAFYTGDRIKFITYTNGTDFISVEIDSRGVYDTSVKITYETEEFSTYIAEKEENSVANL